jgi:hypothetical protein
MKLVNGRLLTNPQLEQISPGIGKLLVEHARSVHIVQQVCDEVDCELDKHMSEYEAKLRKQYRVKSLVREWLNDCLQDEKKKYLEKNQFVAHQRSIERCREERLLQATYFLIREMIFYRDVDYLVLNEISFCIFF